jgi:hypothetical protein
MLPVRKKTIKTRGDPGSFSTLALLMTRVRGADHPNNALTADDLAVAAELLDGSAHFHGVSPNSSFG